MATVATSVVVTDDTIVTDPEDVTDTADSDDVTDAVTDVADSDEVTDTAEVCNLADRGVALDRAPDDLVGFRAGFAGDPPALATLAGLGRPARDVPDPPAAFLPVRFTFAIATYRTPIPSPGERGNRGGYQR